MNDYEKAIRHLRKDPIMKEAIRLGGKYDMKLRGEKTLVHALVHAVAHQQIHGKAALNILGRFVALFPDGVKKFPTPEMIVEKSLDDLRAVGFSQAKALSILEIAKAGVEGRIPRPRDTKKLTDQQIIERLVVLRGVGQWTVEMLLIFTLGRMDVLPVGDFAIREGFKIIKGSRKQPTPKALALYGMRWAPYRSVASWYLWRSLEIE